MTFAPGPHRNRLSTSISSANFSFPQINVLSFLLYFSPRFLFRGRHPYSFQVVDQDRRYPLLKIAPSFSPFIPPRLSALYCSINDTSHAFASRTGILTLELRTN